MIDRMATNVPDGESHFASNATYGDVVPILTKYEGAALLLLGFGGISIILAVLHKCIRRHVFHDADNVDTAFDAGGKVSTSLTAVTVASQLLWPADLLQGSTITVKSGISGPFWYAVGAALNVALFPIMSVHLKTRAPGAKTYLQIMHARFGKPAHLVFCCLALLVNLMAIATLLVAGITIIQSLTKDASDEYCVIIIATLFGSYSLVGGLGTTFYVSYFNAVLIFSTLVVSIVKILHSENTDIKSIGNLEIIYDHLQNMTGPEGNEKRSYLSFRSEGGLVYAVMGLCLTTSLTYCDQASWQSRIAAKPLQGVLGFLIATYIWFAIPSSIAATTGLAFLAMSHDNTTTTLTMDQVNQGLVTPFIAEKLLGPTGGILLLTMIAMALMSTGSGEVMAVSSIIVYDIYQVYINPFMYKVSHRVCILCGLFRLSEQSTINHKDDHDEKVMFCQCPHPSVCTQCIESQKVQARNKDKKKTKIKRATRRYHCSFHGDYRYYQDCLLNYKSWCIIWVTIAMIPFGLLVKASGIDLNWVMLFGFIVTVPCFPAVALTIFSSQTTGKGVISGALVGIVGGISAGLGVASTYDGGLNKFLENTVQNSSVLAGAGTSLGLSFIVTFTVSLLTTNVKSKFDADIEWLKLRDIDNPLHPWCDVYKDDFPNIREGEKPSGEQLDKMFKKAKIVAYVGGFVTLAILVGVVPSVMTSLHVLDFTQFKSWIYALQGLCFSMAAIVVIVAPLEETLLVLKEYRKNKAKSHDKSAEDVRIEQTTSFDGKNTA